MPPPPGLHPVFVAHSNPPGMFKATGHLHPPRTSLSTFLCLLDLTPNPQQLQSAQGWLVCSFLYGEVHDLRGLVCSFWCVPPRGNYEGSRRRVQTQSFQSPCSHSGSIATSTLDLHVCLGSTALLGSSVGSEAAGAAGGRGEEWFIPRTVHLLWLWAAPCNYYWPFFRLLS